MKIRYMVLALSLGAGFPVIAWGVAWMIASI